jgi:hypothetical protein
MGFPAVRLDRLDLSGLAQQGGRLELKIQFLYATF